MICIFGGTFDPVHFGHLRCALDVQQALDIPRVHLLPCRIPPHREAPRMSSAQRLELLQLAIAGEPALAIDARELQREGPSYMVDTLESLRAEHGEQPLCLALGLDAFAGLDSWHRWRDIGRLCHLVLMQRPGKDWPRYGAVADWARQARVDDIAALKRQPAGYIVSMAVTQLEISSTRIRALLGAGRSPRYLLPDAVLERIQQESWYAS
jgi:nicotinate-nucleotide adenylyltransferase